jgi:DNA mismatch endonuclease (patch repair protein)
MDTLTREQRGERMRRIRSKNTKPEILIRKLVHAMGYRYRLHVSKLPGKPDLTFSKHKKVIFIHGCFWHRHPDKNCKLARLPKSRLEFWGNKLEGNRKRDIAKQEELCKLGWDVLIIWECQLRDLKIVRAKIKAFLEA